MSITFRCEHCHKNVEAPEEAAGRRGKCPYCQRTSYIPDPRESEEIPLAEVDESEEKRLDEIERELMEQERAVLAQSGGEPAVAGDSREGVSAEQLYHHVVNYCLDMSESRLERAQTHVAKLKAHGYTGLQAVEDFIAGKAMEPALDPLPGKLLNGFLQGLHDELR